MVNKEDLVRLPAYAKFRELLEELFQFDLADLDFGIYRILRSRREAVQKYLAEELPRKLAEELENLEIGSREDFLCRLDEVRNQIYRLAPNILDDQGNLVAEAEAVAEQLGGEVARCVKRYREIEEAAMSVNLAEEQINDVLLLVYEFLTRYYDEGDFIPVPRSSTEESYSLAAYEYKDDKLAPKSEDFSPPGFHGEETFFWWPTRGMHYIKTDTFLNNYSFEVRTEGLEPRLYRVQFVLDEVEAAVDNNKVVRYFFPKPEGVRLDGDTLLIPVNYRRRQESDENTQQKIFESVLPGLLEAVPEPALRAVLKKPEGEKNEALLLRRLRHFAGLGTKDFFVHPYLKSFLERELDYFIKSQALRAADLFTSTDALQYRVRVLQAFRNVTLDIIDFLDQLEQAQARLFEKKRLVYRADYIVPIRFVPREFWPEILESEAQLKAWNKDLSLEGPITQTMLETNPTLPLYTGHFDDTFKYRLLQKLPFEDLDEATDGVLIHAENYGALRTLEARYREQVKVTYIDPPYNTNSSSIPYKNGFKHSTFASMIHERLKASYSLLSQDGVVFVSIDKHERAVVEQVLNSVFRPENRVEEIIWIMNTTNSQVPTYSTNHEYVLAYAKDLATVIQDPSMFREPKPGYEKVMALVKELNPLYPPITEIEKAIKALYQEHRKEYRRWVESQGLKWEEEKRNDPWKGIYPYSRAEYRDAEGHYVPENEARARGAEIWVWQEGDLSMPATKQSSTTRDPGDPNYRFYRPLHPVTGKPCPHPKSGWKFNQEDFKRLAEDRRIAWGPDEKKVPRIKRFLHETETNVAKSVVVDYSDGEKETSALFGRSGVFLAPKPTSLVARFVRQTLKGEGVVLDYFAGSGSTGHAVVNLNREDGKRRKFILVEMGDYFDAILLRRIQKVMYAPWWERGKPKEEPKIESGEGVALPAWMQRSPRLVKVLRLESYDDSLYNLSETPNEREKAILGFVKERDYLLQYFSDVILDGNPTVMRPEPLEAWKEPEAIRVRRPVPGTPAGFVDEHVDWLETAALWLGVRSKRYREFTANGRTYRVLEGELAGEKTALVLRSAQGLAPEEDRKALEENLGDLRVIVNAPLAAKFEALEDCLEAALWEGVR